MSFSDRCINESSSQEARGDDADQEMALVPQTVRPVHVNYSSLVEAGPSSSAEEAVPEEGPVPPDVVKAFYLGEAPFYPPTWSQTATSLAAQ